MGLSAQASAFYSTRVRLLRAVTVAMCAAGFIALVIGVVHHWIVAQDFLAGSLIVLLPNLWVALKSGSSQYVAGIVALGITKYILTGIGFAVWFALRPDSDALAVFAGSVMALLAMPVVIYCTTSQKSDIRRGSDSDHG